MKLLLHILSKRISSVLVAIFVPMLLLSGVSALIIGGQLDPSFGTAGVVNTPIGVNSRGQSVVIQPDGKIVVAGYTNAGSNQRFALARYSVTGTLDSSFGVQGVVTTSISDSGNDYAQSVALQPDGKLVVVGQSHDGTAGVFAIARYTTTGALDDGFGAGGIVTTSFESNSGAMSVVTQPDGKIVVVGSDGLWLPNFAVARYNDDGSLDSGFGSSGTITISLGGFATANSVLLQPDGKIVIAGGSSGAIVVARCTISGTLDASFGSNGIAMTGILHNYAAAQSVTLQPDGKIVVAGGTTDINIAKTNFVVARLGITGTLDSNFGLGGIITTTVGRGDDYGRSVAIQYGDRIVVGGRSNDGYRDNFALVRYTLDGVPDSGFGVGGVVTSSVDISQSEGSALVLQSDGKIVLAGSSSNDGTNYHFAVARYFDVILSKFVYLPLVRK